ncbi:MAG TPA: hypothetical protein VJC13_00920 [Candidatus Paceibacterota bacterium]|nr:hypothetical protein [uncultured archaeon]
MKTKIILSSIIFLSATMFSVAGAQSVNVNANVSLQANGNGNATSTAAKTSIRGNATSTATINDKGSNATSTDANTDGQLTAEAHRSAVASFVQSLLMIANRENAIGAEVRVVAQSQNDSASTTAEAMTKVEDRGALRTLFFGSDYKNLGVIKSEIVTAENNINQLKNLLAKTTSDTDKAELTAQIKVLEDSKVKVDAFVKTHESSFSLFGWFTKIFAK